jgi:predicted XRE-type DNA-binding protein
MATIRHPITGVELNPIAIERKALNFDEAVTAHILRQRGTKYNQVAQLLGTNTHRVGEVLRGEVHPKAAEAALSLLR